MKLLTTLLTTLLLSLPMAAQSSYSYSTLLSFPPSSRRGAIATPGVPIIDAAGNLYGSAQAGGAYSGGAVWRSSSRGALTTLYSFGATSTDGLYPWSPLTRDSAGNLYGVTNVGGANSWGTIFKVTSTGKGSTLLAFPDGTEASNLTRDTGGDLYGYDASGYGTMFELSASGVYSTPFEFCYTLSCDLAGDDPQGVPIVSRSGVIYGEVDTGSTYNCGAIFTLSGGTMTTLYAFDGASDGCQPWIKPTQDAAGDIYGVTFSGGANDSGVVFKVTPAGVESVLYDFPPSAQAASSLALDTGGTLYGIQGSGASALAYSISPGGVFTVLAYAPGPAGLGYGVVVDAKGNVYGTTPTGGTARTGSVWKLTKR